MATAQTTKGTAPQPRGSGMTVDWNKVPETSSLVSGTYNVRIKKMYESSTSTGGKACWKADLAVIPHNNTKQMNTRVHTNTFTIGSDDDPLASDPDTVAGAFGTRDMKHMFKAAGVKLEPKIAMSARASIGKALTIIGVLPEKPGKNQTRVFFNVTEWLPLGKKEPCIDAKTEDGEIAASNGRPRRGAPAAEPDDEPAEAETELEAGAEEGGAEVTEPTDEPEAEEDAGEGDAVDEPEEEPPPAKTKAKGAKEDTVTCGMCEKDIPRSQYKTHVPKCNG